MYQKIQKEVRFLLKFLKNMSQWKKILCKSQGKIMVATHLEIREFRESQGKTFLMKSQEDSRKYCPSKGKVREK